MRELLPRLLPQPGGFEGFVSGREPDHLHDLALAERPDPGRAVLKLDPAYPPASTDAENRDDLFPSVDQLVAAEVHLLPTGVQVQHPTPDAGHAVVTATSHEGPPYIAGDVELDIWMPERADRGIRPLKGVEHPPDNLDVLLRHRPLSIPLDLGSASGERRAEPPGREGGRLPPLVEMDEAQRRELHEALLDADGFEDLPGKWQAAILEAEQSRPKLRASSAVLEGGSQIAR
jgi:hypothetical protein